MTFNYKFKRFYEIFLICVIISIRCIYFYPLNVYLVLLFTDDGRWRKSLGADDIHDDVAIIRRGRLQWMLFHCVDGCRPTLHDAFWRDVFACVTSFVSLKMMSPRLIRHRLRDLWWWRALAQADWDGLGGAGSSSKGQWCSDGVFWNTQSSSLGVCPRLSRWRFRISIHELP